MGKSKLIAKFKAGGDEPWRVPLASACDKDEFEVIESRGNGAAASGKKDKKRKKAPEGDRGEQLDSPKRKKNANLKRTEEANAEPAGNDRDDAGSPDQSMRRKKKKKKKKTKTKTKTEGTTMEHGSSKNEGSREGQAAPDLCGVTVHVFPTDDADHAETPRAAYQHVAPILRRLAEELGKAPAELRIYDPFFCTGAVRRNLEAEGFPRVYNKNEDFYVVQHEGRVPEHDVVVTNPPYSSDHIPRLLRWVVKNGKPWLLLVPNYVYMKDYYQRSLGACRPMYLCPPDRYTYESPKGVADATGKIRKSGERKTAPYMSFWSSPLSRKPNPRKSNASGAARAHRPRHQHPAPSPSTVEQLPHNMRDSFDPLRKRLPKHLRAKQRKTHAPDGRKLCKQCGQIWGNCKHTREA